MSFAEKVFSVIGKGRQLWEDSKRFEGWGLFAGSIFTAAGFIMSFFSTPAGPDANKELLKSINQTVTATYEAVLQIQNELQTIAKQLESLNVQMQEIFTILHAEESKTQCLTALGTLVRARQVCRWTAMT